MPELMKDKNDLNYTLVTKEVTIQYVYPDTAQPVDVWVYNHDKVGTYDALFELLEQELQSLWKAYGSDSYQYLFCPNDWHVRIYVFDLPHMKLLIAQEVAYLYGDEALLAANESTGKEQT